MLRILTLLVAILAMMPSQALSQVIDEPKWDFAVTTGLLEGQPREERGPYYNGHDWYSSARLGASLGRYWTPNLKTEVEVMTSTEGMRYATREAVTPEGQSWPYGVQEYYRLSQGSVRGVWQLLDNRWIHPYFLAGITFDLERQRTYAGEQFRYVPPTPGSPSSRELLVPQRETGPDTVHRIGAIVGGGAKLYMSANTFANAGLLMSYAKPARHVSLIFGFGLDF